MIIKTNQDEFESYLEDTSNLKGMALALYIPQTSGELRAIIRDFYAKKTPFTITAGRTGTTAGCVAQSGVVVSLEKLNRLIGIDKTAKVMHIESGMTFKELEEAAGKFNFALRASPTESLAFVGGAISTCASGVRGFGYGSIRNYISVVSVVLPDAEVIEIERGKIFARQRTFDFEYQGRRFKFNLPSYTSPEIKSQAGYFTKDNMDLIDLFIGSEGTLGVITSCKVSLQEAVQAAFDGIIFFKKEEDGLDFVSKIKALKDKNKIHPAALEFFDGNSVQLLKIEGGYPFLPDCACAIYFEQTAQGRDRTMSCPCLMDKWINLIDEFETFSDNNILADTVKERERVFEIRHKLPVVINEFLRKHKQIKASSDCAVPFAKLPQMYSFYKEKAKESGLDYVNFGHIGEAHLHFNFLPKNSSESLKAKRCLELFCQKAVSLGGTVSAEHGIGKIKKPYLKIMYNQAQIQEMAQLKKYFDPACLMGLDNVFAKEVLYHQ